MSAYITQAQLEARFTAERVAQLFSVQNADGSTTGAADAPSLAASISDACAEIDECLGTMYVVPFVAPLPDSLIEIASVITMYRGLLRRPEYMPEMKPIFEPQYQAACKRLDEIRLGKRKLSVALVSSNSGGTLTQNNTTCARPFYFLPNPRTGQGGMQGF